MTAPATARPRPALAAVALLAGLAASPIPAQEPTALSVSPALPTTEDGLLLRLTGFGCAPQLEAPARNGETITWAGSSVQCIRATYWRVAHLPPGPESEPQLLRLPGVHRPVLSAMKKGGLAAAPDSLPSGLLDIDL